MVNNCVNFNGKLSIKRASLTNPTKLCSFDVQHPNLDKINVRVKDVYPNLADYYSEVTNKQNSLLGYEEFDINRKNHTMFGLSIRTIPTYRGQSIGEILRLTSIIEMLENKIKTFKIYSISDAIYFHSKYKFEPNISKFGEQEFALKTIANSDFSEKAKRAKNIQSQLFQHPISNEKEQELYKKTNNLTSQFIEDVQANSEQAHNNFYMGMDMILTEENVLKNRDFYNSLFKKHNIDYQI